MNLQRLSHETKVAVIVTFQCCFNLLQRSKDSFVMFLNFSSTFCPQFHVVTTLLKWQGCESSKWKALFWLDQFLPGLTPTHEGMLDFQGCERAFARAARLAWMPRATKMVRRTLGHLSWTKQVVGGRDCCTLSLIASCPNILIRLIIRLF